jgi:hypothetical protein
MITYQTQEKYLPIVAAAIISLNVQQMSEAAHGLTPAVGARQYSAEAFARDEFAELESYDFADWDLNGAEPITAETLRIAREFRDRLPLDWPRPDIAPASDGTIGLEWRILGDSIVEFAYVDVGPGDTIKARFVHSDGGAEELPPYPLATSDPLLDRLAREFS